MGSWSFVPFAFPWAPSLPVSWSLWISSGRAGGLWPSCCSRFPGLRLAPGSLSFQTRGVSHPWQGILATELFSAVRLTRCECPTLTQLCSLPSSPPLPRATVPCSSPAESDPCPVLSLVLPRGKPEEGKGSRERAALFAGPAALSILLEPKQEMAQQDPAWANTGAPQRLLPRVCLVLPLPFELWASISPA